MKTRRISLPAGLLDKKNSWKNVLDHNASYTAAVVDRDSNFDLVKEECDIGLNQFHMLKFKSKKSHKYFQSKSTEVSKFISEEPSNSRPNLVAKSTKEALEYFSSPDLNRKPDKNDSEKLVGFPIEDKTITEVEQSKEVSAKIEPNLCETMEERRRSKELSLDAIIAKVSSIPAKGSLSGYVKSNPSSLVNAWEVQVEIDSDPTHDTHQISESISEDEITESENATPNKPLTLTTKSLSKNNFITADKIKSQVSPISPRPMRSLLKSDVEERKEYKSKNKLMNSLNRSFDKDKSSQEARSFNLPDARADMSMNENITRPNVSAKLSSILHGKTSEHNLEGASELRNHNTEIRCQTGSQKIIDNEQDESFLSEKPVFDKIIDSGSTRTRWDFMSREMDFPNICKEDVFSHRITCNKFDIKEKVQKTIDLQQEFGKNELNNSIITPVSEKTDNPVSKTLESENELKMLVIQEKIDSQYLSKKRNTSQEKHLSQAEKAKADVIRSSRFRQDSPSFLSEVKEKLEQEKIRSEKPKLRRTITQHDQPLYALVMKEAIDEYEKQRHSNDVIQKKQHTQKNQTSPNFINIMEQKLKEKAPDVTDELGNLDSSENRKASITEPLYASVIRKTFQDYEKEKKEHEPVRKVGMNLGDPNTTSGCLTPNFLSILHINLKRKRLLFDDGHEDCDINTALCQDEPLYAIVIKAAVEEHRKSLSRNDERRLEQTERVCDDMHDQVSPSLTASTSNNNAHDNSRKHYDGDHSHSSSDISVTSEEVKQINKMFFSSVDKRNIQKTISEENQELMIRAKPFLPLIPSPDYIPKISEVEKMLATSESGRPGIEKTVEEPDHPHHIMRPFWNDVNDNKKQDFNSPDLLCLDYSSIDNTSNQILPTSGSMFKNVYDQKIPKRSSLRKNESQGKLAVVSFVNQVEVIDEVAEVKGGKVIMHDLRSESPLNGSPQTEFKRKKTPYHSKSDIEPIDEDIFQEAKKQKDKLSRHLSREEDNKIGGLFAEELIQNECLLDPNCFKTNTLSQPVVYKKVEVNENATVISEKIDNIAFTRNEEVGKFENFDSDKAILDSKAPLDKEISDTGKRHNSVSTKGILKFDIKSLKDNQSQRQNNEVLNIALDVVTNTDQDGKTTVKIIPEGNAPVNIDLPDFVPQQARRELPPPPIDRSSKPRESKQLKKVETDAKPKSIGDIYAVVKKSNKENENSSMRIDVRYGKNSLLRTIIPSPDYSPDNSPNVPRKVYQTTSGVFKTKEMFAVHEEIVNIHKNSHYESIDLNRKSIMSSKPTSQVDDDEQIAVPSPYPVETSLIRILSVDDVPGSQPSPRDIETPPAVMSQGTSILPKPEDHMLCSSRMSIVSTPIFTFENSNGNTLDNVPNKPVEPPPVPDRSKKPKNPSWSNQRRHGPLPSLPKLDEKGSDT